MKWWFMGLLVYGMITLVIHLAKNGDERTDKYSFFVSLFFLLLAFFFIYMAIKQGC